MFEVEAIVVVVERGKADMVVRAAMEKGASGATIFSGRGNGDTEMRRLFNFDIDSFKEIIFILADKGKIRGIIDSIIEIQGMEGSGKGIVFTLPVSQVISLQTKKGLGESD